VPLNAVTVGSWEALIEKVRRARVDLDVRPNEELWFRGVRDRSYELTPSLLRCFPEKNRTHDRIIDLEINLFFEFLAKARTAGPALDHWDTLFLMQHYRVPTRLLDWTEVLTVALHFCVAYAEKSDCPRLYMMNPYRWNDKQTDFRRELVWPRYFGYDAEEEYFYEYGELLIENGIDWLKPVALYPPQRDARLSAQRGYFTIHGTDVRPIEKISPGLLRAIDLDRSAVPDIQEQLELCGINEYSLFPDLEGLARHLKKRYRLP
jgi:hypothetical protein